MDTRRNDSTISRIDRGDELPLVSVIISIYNDLDDLKICLPSLLGQEYAAIEVFVVDNASSDGGVCYVEETFPDITVVDAGGNVGYGAANNIGASHANGEFLAILNPDTILEPDFLQVLVETIQAAPDDVGFVTPKILLRSQPDRVNTCGNDVHFTGIPACRGWLLPADRMKEVEEVNSISGAAFLVRRSVFEELGGFDGDFFFYVEDNDLSWRGRLAGYRCLYVPRSIIYHEYSPRFYATKLYWLERNRYRMLLKNLRWRTLFLFLPALILSEIVTWGFAMLQSSGHLAAKLRAYMWMVRNWRMVMKDREVVQANRSVDDAVLLKSSSSNLAYGLAQEGSSAKLAGQIFDPLFRLFHNLYSVVIHW